MAGGKNEILFSGYITTNSFAYRKASVLGFGEATILLNPITITSGYTLAYNVRAFPANEAAPTYSFVLHSGVLNSGFISRLTLGDAYDEVDVGLKNATSNKSGRVTVSISRKRRQ